MYPAMQTMPILDEGGFIEGSVRDVLKRRKSVDEKVADLMRIIGSVSDQSVGAVLLDQNVRSGLLNIRPESNTKT